MGKSASDLQTGVTFNQDGTVTGTLQNVTDYTGFSGNVEEQSGHYIAFHAEVPDEEDVTITAKINNISTLDSDGIAVFRVTDLTKPLIVTASKDGETSVSKSFDLSSLTLAE